MKQHLCNPLLLLLYLFFHFQELVLLFSFWAQKTHRTHLIGWHRVNIALCTNVVLPTGNVAILARNNLILLPGMNKLVIWLWSFCLGHDKESFVLFFSLFSELYVNLLEELCLQRLVLLVYIGSNTKEDRSCQLDEKMTKWDWSKRWRQIMKWKEKR